MEKKKEYRMGIRLDYSQIKLLKEISELEHVTLSILMRHVIDQFIKKYRKGLKK